MAGAFSYGAVPVFNHFEQVSDPATYTPLPDDWCVGITDVVRSTDAIATGRYKAVNMAGVSAVSAVMNAVGHASFPFVFGGDGSVLAVSPEDVPASREALARAIRFADEDLGLTLRAGTITVGEIRKAGHDVRVARYAASPEAVYAMFSGGGCSYAESELKAGRIALPPAAPGERPDLTGLSCRWAPIEARRGVMLSLLALPAEGAPPGEFRKVAADVIALVQDEEREGNPVAAAGPDFVIRPAAMMMEAKAARAGHGSVARRLARIAGEMALAVTLDKTGQSLGGFDPKRYRSWVARNTDFRKYEDGLRMTVDCSPATADRLEALLADAEAARIVDYGLHRQDAALMTCIVPSPMRNDHLHFLDGAGGGYALSAQALKQRLAARMQGTA